MLAELVVILVILITVAFIYLKGTVIKAFLLLINTFVASTVAFAYFETLGRLIIGYGFLSELAFAVVSNTDFCTCSCDIKCGQRQISADRYILRRLSGQDYQVFDSSIRRLCHRRGYFNSSCNDAHRHKMAL